MTLPTFDELHIISDLHLGGSTGRQIFTSTKEATAFLKHLSAKKKGQIGLVINGDLVDFLAEPGAVCFDHVPDSAESKLNAIATRDEFKPVFDGLSDFIKGSNHHLAIVLGNHDLELAMPWMRHALLDLLTKENAAARSRITLVLDGCGFRAQVGRAKVICVHGNEVDSWNYADYEKLRAIGRDVWQGNTVEPWKPNAGSRMVAEVMNGIKKDWPFVDLLKPEGAKLGMVLLAIDPTLSPKILPLIKLGAQQWVDGIIHPSGMLGEPPEAGSNRTGGPESALLAGFGIAPSRNQNPSALLKSVEGQFEAGLQPSDLIGSDQGMAYLGTLSELNSSLQHWFLETGNSITEWRKKRGRELLRKALRAGLDDNVFNITQKDETFVKLDEKLGGEFDFVVVGHTHLERSLQRSNGSGHYFNSGTWAGVMKLENALLTDDAKFENFMVALQEGSLAALEKAKLVTRRNTLVSITVGENSSVTGQLFSTQVSQDKLLLDPVPDSERVI